MAEEQLADPSFRAEWQRLAPAREFAATLLRYRAEHKLSQRALAKKLGVSQPCELESGEHNSEVDTIINAVRRRRSGGSAPQASADNNSLHAGHYGSRVNEAAPVPCWGNVPHRFQPISM